MIKIRSIMIFVFSVSFIACESMEKDKSGSRIGVASIDDGTLFRMFCDFHLSDISDETPWSELREKLDASAKNEQAYREISEFGEIVVSRNRDKWVIILVGECEAQVYMEGNANVKLFDAKP